MMHLLTCRSPIIGKDQDEQATVLKVWQSNAIFHVYCSLYLFVSGTLMEFNLFDPNRLNCYHSYRRLCSNLEALPSTGELRNSSVRNYDIIPFEI